MIKALFLGVLISSYLICSQSFAEEKSPSNETEKTENESSSSNEPEKPHSNGEIILDVVKGVCSSAAAGVAAASGNIPATVGGIIIGSEKFIEAAKKYNENVQFEKEAESSREKDDYDRSHDRDSWDRDY